MKLNRKIIAIFIVPIIVVGLLISNYITGITINNEIDYAISRTTIPSIIDESNIEFTMKDSFSSVDIECNKIDNVFDGVTFTQSTELQYVNVSCNYSYEGVTREHKFFVTIMKLEETNENIDTTPPVLLYSETYKFYVNEVYNYNITATDDVSDNITLTIDDSSVNYGIPGTYTVIVKAIDEALNETSITIEVNIVNRAVTTVVYEGYYEGATDLVGTSLKTFLHNLIDDHTVYSYTSAWDILSYTDEDPNNTDNVILIYTGRSQDKDLHGGAADDWNREHIWPRSLGGFETTMGPGTDLHALRPSDASINSTRGNKLYGYGTDAVYDGGILTDCLKTSEYFEPRDEVKGDVARMIFYMAVRYEGDDEFQDLEISNNPSGYQMGVLDVLIEWHLNDLPDEFEIERNNRIAEYQGNRNPFIDHPEFVQLIWGD